MKQENVTKITREVKPNHGFNWARCTLWEYDYKGVTYTLDKVVSSGLTKDIYEINTSVGGQMISTFYKASAIRKWKNLGFPVANPNA